MTRNVNRLISDIINSLIFTVTNVGGKLIEMCGGIADLGVEIAQRFFLVNSYTIAVRKKYSLIHKR